MDNIVKQNDCYEYKEKKHSAITASFGKKTKYEFDNSKKQYIFSKVQVDQCYIKNKTACDWLLEMNTNRKDEKSHLIFVELKDSDFIKAVEQIEQTIEDLIDRNNKFIIHARIVLTKTYSPDILDKRVQKFKRKIELLQGTIDYGSQYLKEKIIS